MPRRRRKCGEGRSALSSDVLGCRLRHAGGKYEGMCHHNRVRQNSKYPLKDTRLLCLEIRSVAVESRGNWHLVDRTVNQSPAGELRMRCFLRAWWCLRKLDERHSLNAQKHVSKLQVRTVCCLPAFLRPARRRIAPISV